VSERERREANNTREREDLRTMRVRETQERPTTREMEDSLMREGLLTQMTEGDGDEEFVQVKKRRARKRKRNAKKSEELDDVGSDIPLVHDKALTRCLPMGCHSCKKYGGLRCVDMDNDTGNAQLRQSFCNDGRRRLSESCLCILNAPPVSHLDVCGIAKNSVEVVDGCHCHRTCFLPLVELGNDRSNAQLCESSVDDHRRRLLGSIPCKTMVEETGHINVQHTLDQDGTPVRQSNVNFSIGAADNETTMPSRYHH